MKYLASLQANSADFTYKTTLGSIQYAIRMVWNSRCKEWFLTIVDQYGGRIDGVKVVEKWPLLRARRAQIRMDGDLIAIPATSDPTIRLGYENLGTEWYLTYMTSDEIFEWETNNGMG